MPTRRETTDAYALKSIKDSLPSLSFSSTSNPTSTTNSTSNYSRPSLSTRQHRHEDSPEPLTLSRPRPSSSDPRRGQGATHRSDHRGRSPDVRYISPYSDDSDDSSAYAHRKQHATHPHQKRETYSPPPPQRHATQYLSAPSPYASSSKPRPSRKVSIQPPTGALYDSDRRRKGLEGGYHLGSELYSGGGDGGGRRGRGDEGLGRRRERGGRDRR